MRHPLAARVQAKQAGPTQPYPARRLWIRRSDSKAGSNAMVSWVGSHQGTPFQHDGARWRSMALSALVHYALQIKARCPGLSRTKSYLEPIDTTGTGTLRKDVLSPTACKLRSQILTMSPCEGSNGFSPCRLLISSAKGSRPRASPWVRTT